MASITLTPSKIGDVRSYYKRVRTVEQGGGVTSDHPLHPYTHTNPAFITRLYLCFFCL